MREPNLKATKSGDDVVLEVYDDIGPSWAGMIDAKAVSRVLGDAGEFKEIDLRINSRGGSAYDGFAIFNVLRKSGAKIKARVEGIAASAASIVLMAGTTRHVPKNAFVMIHDPAVFAYGGEKEVKSALDQLKTIKKAAMSTYAEATKLSEKEIADMMAAETWMTGDEALEKGFATAVDPEVDLAAVSIPAMEVPSFITRAPEQFSRLAALCITSPLENSKMTAPATPAATPATPVDQPTAPQLVTTAPSTPTVTEPKLTAADVQKAAADASAAAVTAERTRISEITQLCKMAGHPELAQKHIDDGANPVDVQKAMFALMVAERKPVGDNAGTEQKTGDEKYKAEFSEHRDVFMQQGITEERYINSRRVDDGLQPHPAK